MKILVVTDIHSTPEKVFNFLDENFVDQIIVTGDVTEFGPDELFIDTLNKLNKYAPVYALQGNCDPKNASVLIDKSEAVNIHSNKSNIENITVVGFGGSNPTPFDTPNEYDEEILYEELSKFKDDLDTDSFTILVTHAPPYDTNADKIESGAHVGSTSIRKIIEQTQPTLNLCGHVHESIGEDKIGKTIVVNPGDAKSGHACIITLSDEDIENHKVNLELITL